MVWELARHAQQVADSTQLMNSLLTRHHISHGPAPTTQHATCRCLPISQSICRPILHFQHTSYNTA
jgi:hypothetical protein